MFERFVKGIVEREGKKAIIEIPLDSISVNPFQPRKHFDQRRLDDLSKSIREQGVIQPIIVRRLGSGYELVAGERRLRASRMAGNKSIPAIVRKLNDRDMIEIAFIENLQREQLDEHEEAEAYCRIMREGSYDEQAAAERVGTDIASIQKRMWLLRLSHTVKKAVVSKLISIGHAQALSEISDEPTQNKLLEKIYREKLSREETLKLVDELDESLKYETNDDIASAEEPGNEDSMRKLESCVSFIREYVAAVRSAGIPVELAASVRGGRLEVHMAFVLDPSKPTKAS